MPLETSVFGQVETDLKNRKYNSALRKLSLLSVRHSKNIQYLICLSQALKALGDQDALIKTLKELNRQQADIETEIEIMALLYKNAQINEALDIGLSLQDKNLTATQKTNLYCTLMRIYIEENDFDGVKEMVEQSEEIVNQNDFMLWAHGLACLSNNDRNQALSRFRKAVELNPKNDQVWVSLALVHQQMGDEELGLANLEKALDCNPLNNAAVKLYSQWAIKKSDKAQKALDSVRFYLTEHEFDEEISVCHVQLLCQMKHFNTAQSEIQKLILTHPRNINYPEMKKNLEQNLNL